MSALEQYLKEVKERADAADFNCYCALPGCVECYEDYRFHKNARTDIPKLLEMVQAVYDIIKDSKSYERSMLLDAKTLEIVLNKIARGEHVRQE